MEGRSIRDANRSLLNNQIQKKKRMIRRNKQKQTSSEDGTRKLIAGQRLPFTSLFECKFQWYASFAIRQRKQERSGGILKD